jgi:hypothetical protein
MHAYIHTYIYTACRHIHTYIPACIHTYIHAYIRTLIHTYIHRTEQSRTDQQSRPNRPAEQSRADRTDQQSRAEQTEQNIPNNTRHTKVVNSFPSQVPQASFTGICASQTPSATSADVLCSNQVQPQCSVFAGNTTNPCQWAVTKMLNNNRAQFIVQWPVTALANFGADPTLTFQAIVSNPPPQSVSVTLSSYDPVTQIGVDCTISTILASKNINSTTGAFLSQPQTYSYTFSKTFCEANFGAPFKADHINQFSMAVSTASTTPNERAFTLISSTVPPGPCFSTSMVRPAAPLRVVFFSQPSRSARCPISPSPRSPMGCRA